MHNTRTAGFTLIELMVVVAILAIFASIAMPAFNTLIENNRLKSAADEFQALLVAARTDAVTKRASIDVSLDGTTWSSGERTVTVPDSIVMNADKSTITFNANGTATESSVTFNDSHTLYTITTKPAGLIRKDSAAYESSDEASDETTN